MNEDFLSCDDDRCVLMVEDLEGNTSESEQSAKFNKVIADIARVYPDALLVGAVAAAKYIRHPNEPRQTRDVDVILGEKDFAEFIVDEIPEDRLNQLETYFENSDSLNHSMRHKETGIYVDFLSTESQPIRKSLVRRILGNRSQATHYLQNQQAGIEILKPEYLIAMKVMRLSKYYNTERGASDRQDIVKLLQTMEDRNIPLDHILVRSLLNRLETGYYEKIIAAREQAKLQALD